MRNLPALLRSNEVEKNQGFCRTVNDVNVYIGADNTSQTPIEFDSYNPHPYHIILTVIRVPQEILKSIRLTRFFSTT